MEVYIGTRLTPYVLSDFVRYNRAYDKYPVLKKSLENKVMGKKVEVADSLVDFIFDMKRDYHPAKYLRDSTPLIDEDTQGFQVFESEKDFIKAIKNSKVNSAFLYNKSFYAGIYWLYYNFDHENFQNMYDIEKYYAVLRQERQMIRAT